MTSVDHAEAQAAVDTIFGKGKAEVVDVQTRTVVREEEVISINGQRVHLLGDEGEAIRHALTTGTVPSPAVLRKLLTRNGIINHSNQPNLQQQQQQQISSAVGESSSAIQVETSLKVNTRLTTKDTMFLRQNGQLMDHRCNETRRDGHHTGNALDLLERNGVSRMRLGEASESSVVYQHLEGPASVTAAADVMVHAEEVAGDYDTCGHDEEEHQLTSSDLFGGSLTKSLNPALTNNDSGYMNSGDSETGEESSCGDIWRKCNGSSKNTLSKPSIFGTVADSASNCSGSIQRSCSPASLTAETFRASSPVQVNARRSRPLPPSSACSSSSRSCSPAQHCVNSTSVRSPEVVIKRLQFKDGGLTSGNLEELIHHLIPSANHYPDRAYIFAFLLSARLYIRPHELLQRVAAAVALEENPSRRLQPSLAKVASGVLELLSEWCDTFPYDFRDERVMNQVRVISQSCIRANPDLQLEVRTVLQGLLEKLTCLEKYEEHVEKLNIQAAKSQNASSTTDISEVCSSPVRLAQQLTRIELERLSYIGPEEFVQAFAKESRHIETEYKDLKTTKNLESYIQWFNRLSYLVATEVCTHMRKRHRVRLIDFWTEVGRECFNTGNFNSLMAIIAGLNMSPVTRLKKTWARLDGSQLSVLEQQMSPSSNFLSYRRTLQAAMWRSTSNGGVDGRQKVVIPFFSLLVKDLYFLNEGCANRLPGGHINLDKFWQLARQVTEFIAWKQVSCPFDADSTVIEYLTTGPVFDEHALWLASYECEHPENGFEKERLKILKSELKSL